MTDGQREVERASLDLAMHGTSDTLLRPRWLVFLVRLFSKKQ
jgi:hypothetical protein